MKIPNEVGLFEGQLGPFEYSVAHEFIRDLEKLGVDVAKKSAQTVMVRKVEPSRMLADETLKPSQGDMECPSWTSQLVHVGVEEKQGVDRPHLEAGEGCTAKYSGTRFVGSRYVDAWCGRGFRRGARE